MQELDDIPEIQTEEVGITQSQQLANNQDLLMTLNQAQEKNSASAKSKDPWSNTSKSMAMSGGFGDDFDMIEDVEISENQS